MSVTKSKLFSLVSLENIKFGGKMDDLKQVPCLGPTNIRGPTLENYFLGRPIALDLCILVSSL
jgi:hypothetical protein